MGWRNQSLGARTVSFNGIPKLDEARAKLQEKVTEIRGRIDEVIGGFTGGQKLGSRLMGGRMGGTAGKSGILPNIMKQGVLSGKSPIMDRVRKIRANMPLLKPTGRRNMNTGVVDTGVFPGGAVAAGAIEREKGGFPVSLSMSVEM